MFDHLAALVRSHSLDGVASIAVAGRPAYEEKLFIYRETLRGNKIPSGPCARAGENETSHTGDMGVTTFFIPFDALIDGIGDVGAAVPTRLMARLFTLPPASFSCPPFACSMTPNSTATPTPGVTLSPALPSVVG